MPGCPFWYTLILPCILLSSSGYKAVQGGTRQWNWYNEVQGSTRNPVPLDSEVQGSTWRYKALYRLVPHYPGVRDFLVLPCTAWYRLVSRRGQGSMRENQNLGNMLVCTSTYLCILVYADSYQSCKSMYWFILLRIFTIQYVLVQTSTDTYLYVLTCTGM